MELSHLETLFTEARRLSKQSEFVVVGSLSILGIVHRSADIPARMLMSIDVDCYSKADPGRIFELSGQLGQGSRFEAEHGYYLDPISPDVLTLPDQWQHRLRDREWIRAGLQAGLLSAAIIEGRFRDTAFLDAAESERARNALAQDRKFLT